MAFDAQWVIVIQMRAGQTMYLAIFPGDDLVKQTHSPSVGNQFPDVVFFKGIEGRNRINASGGFARRIPTKPIQKYRFRG